jgi:hypothetical protein
MWEFLFLTDFMHFLNFHLTNSAPSMRKQSKLISNIKNSVKNEKVSTPCERNRKQIKLASKPTLLRIITATSMHV